MKSKIQFLAFEFGLILCFFVGSVQAQVNRQKLFSVGMGETVVYGESEIYLGNDGEKVSLVTVDSNGKYFHYDKGEKRGPFENPDSCHFKLSENDESIYTSILNSEVNGRGEELAAFDDEGRQIIRSGNKILGPFESILNIWADKDGRFLAAVISEGTKYSMLTTNASIIPLEGIPYATNVSPSGNKILMTVIKEENPALDYMNQDFSNMTQEDLLRISNEIAEKQKNAPPAEAFIYSNDGKKFGPFPKDAVYGVNPFFSKTSGDTWLFLNGTELYVNGALMAKIPLDNVSSGDVWLSEDEKRYAVIAYEKILFSDGQSYPFPLRIRMAKKNGKTWLSWINLENQTDVVLYSRFI